MAVVSRIAKITFDNGLGSTRTWTATAATQDTAAGSSVVITVTNATTGGAPPAVTDTLTLTYADDNSGVIKSVTLNNTSASQTDTFFFTNNGLTGGSARCGTVEIKLRATKTTGGGLQTYDVETDGAPNTPPTGFSSATDRGWIRGTTTATVSTSNVSAGGAKPNPYAYTTAGGDTIFHRVVFGSAIFISRTLTATVGAIVSQTSASGTQTFDTTMTNVVDNRFPASSSSQVADFTVGNATLTGLPFTVITTNTTDTLTIDPRLTRTPLFQLDDNTFGTPPSSKNRAQMRTTAQQGFLGSRTTNARSEGVNGITYNIALTPRKPGTPVTQTGLTTTTQGGETGWSSQLTAWSSSLPGGIWDKSFTVTAPSDITGASYTVNAAGTSTEYQLLARDPNIEVRVNANHEQGFSGRHFSAGMAIVPTAYLIDVSTQKRIASSLITSAKVAAVRGFGSAADGTGSGFQYLDATNTWVTWNPADAQYLHTMTVSAGDSTVFEKRFVSDNTWGLRDVRFGIQLLYEGIVYSDSYIVVNVDTKNRHDGHDFDAVGIFK